MFVNYTNKHLFIHIPKTGGTSIHKCYIDKYEDTFVNSTKKWSENNIEKINGHIFMKELLKIENFTDFNSFAVVRNPYELVISHYFFSKMKYNYSDSFDDFIELMIQPNAVRNPMLDYISDDYGNVLVKKILRFENLKDELFNLIGINIDNYHLLKSTHDDYRVYYNHDRKKKVHEYFKDDLEYFNYKF